MIIIKLFITGAKGGAGGHRPPPLWTRHCTLIRVIMCSIIRYIKLFSAVLKVTKTSLKKAVLVTLGDFLSDLVLHRAYIKGKCVRPFDNTLGIV